VAKRIDTPGTKTTPGSEKTRTKEAERYIEVLLSASEVLGCFFDHDRLQLKELTAMTGLNKSRIIRICGTLVYRNFLSYDDASKTYRLGHALLVLGKRYENSNDLISVSKPILHKLVMETGESSSLFVRDGDKRVCLVREEGVKAVRYIIREGQRLELYAGASGKTLLAFMDKGEREALLEKISLEPLTPRTIVDEDAYRLELDEIRRVGYAFSLGERSENGAGLSAPVFEHQGRLVAAISVSGPIDEFAGGKYLSYLKPLLEATAEVSRSLGYAGGGNGSWRSS